MDYQPPLCRLVPAHGWLFQRVKYGQLVRVCWVSGWLCPRGRHPHIGQRYPVSDVCAESFRDDAQADPAWFIPAGQDCHGAGFSSGCYQHGYFFAPQIAV
jgi:hypothetical protein